MRWLALLLLPLAAQAAEYRISQADSIASANALPLVAGDRVFFQRGGRWDGRTLILKPGVTYSTYGNGSPPVISRAVEINNWADTGGILSASTSADVLLLTEDGMVLPYASGPDLTDGAWYLAKAPGLTTIYYRPTPGAVHRVERHDGAAIIGHGATGATVDGLELFGAGLYARNASGLKIRRCRFRWADVTIVANGQELANVEVSDSLLVNSNEGIYVGTESNGTEIIRNARVLRNVVLATGLLHGGQSWLPIKKRDREAIGLQNMIGGLVSGNVILGGAAGGGISYWSHNGIDQPLNGNVFERNYIDAVQHFGIGPGGAGFGNNAATVRYNQISRTGMDGKSSGGIRLNRQQIDGPVYGNVVDSILFNSLPAGWSVYANTVGAITGNSAGNSVGANGVYP